MYCVFPEKSSEEEILGEFVKYIDQVNGEIEGRRSETGSCWGYLIIAELRARSAPAEHHG